MKCKNCHKEIGDRDGQWAVVQDGELTRRVYCPAQSYRVIRLPHEPEDVVEGHHDL